MEHLLKLIQRVDDFISLGSGWIVSSLNSVKLNVTPFNLHRAGSYIETPQELESKKRCLLNIVNRSDHLCFLYGLSLLIIIISKPVILQEKHITEGP